MEGSVNTNGVGEASIAVGVIAMAVGNATVAREIGVAVGITNSVSATAVLTVDIAVSITSVGLVARELLQDVRIIAARNKRINGLSKIFTFHIPLMFCQETPNVQASGANGLM